MRASIIVSIFVLHSCFAQNSDRKLVVLTDFIESGDIDGGLKAARIEPMFGERSEGTEYAGFFRVNNHGTDYLLFFWYFPCEERTPDYVRNAPLIFWLQGPPASSLVGLFYEHGPMELVDIDAGIEEKEDVVRRQWRWSKHAGIVYIDVFDSTGFSLREKGPDPPTRTVESAGMIMYQMVLQFSRLFSITTDSNVFFAGEGYASKIVLSAACQVIRASENETLKNPIPLKGVILQSPAIDPGFMVYGQHLAQLGLIDLDALPEILEKEKEFVSTYNTKQFAEFPKVQSYLDQYVHHHLDPTLIFYQLPREINPDNYVKVERNPPDWEVPRGYIPIELERYFRKEGILSKLNIPEGKTRFLQELFVDPSFQDRRTSSIWYADVRSLLEEVLNHCHVLIFNGELDLFFNAANTQLFASSLKWSGSDSYVKANRDTWEVNDEFAGFFKTGGNLTVVMVRGAGRTVAKDQPLFTFLLVNSFIQNRHSNLGSKGSRLANSPRH